MRRLLTTLIGCALLTGVLHLPVRAPIDDEGYWRNPSLIGLFFPQVEGAYRASVIKSIQKGVISIADPATSNTATLSPAVDLAETVVQLQGWSSPTSETTRSAWIVRTNTTTVTANITAIGGGQTVRVGYAAIEYYPNVINQVEDVSVTLAAGVDIGTDTIAAMATAKTYIAPRGVSADNASANNVWQTVFTDWVQTNTTTVTATRGATTTTNIVAYGTAVEFK